MLYGVGWASELRKRLCDEGVQYDVVVDVCPIYEIIVIDVLHVAVPSLQLTLAANTTSSGAERGWMGDGGSPAAAG